MTGINPDFKKLVATAVINTTINEKAVFVSTADLGAQYYYACYLIVNGTTVETYGYQQKPEFSFDLENYSFSDEINVRYYFQDTNLKERTAKSVKLKDLRKRAFFLKTEIVKLSTNTVFAQLGLKIVEDGELKLGGFKEYSIKGKKDFWEDDPFENRSWQWRLHWFEFINHLLAYHCQTQNNKALEFIKKMVESWIEKYATRPSDFEFIWHDHATALRAEVLLVLHAYLIERCPKWLSLNQIFLENIKSFLEISKQKLEEESFYSKHTNHGLEQARVLLLLSIFFDDNLAQELSVARISSELQYSFTAEGVHKENSPGYHQFVLKVFLGIISVFPKNILGDLSNEFDEIGAKALEFIAHILRPDCNFPIIGDTELLPATDSYSEYFKNNIEYQWYLYSATGGKRGEKPQETFKVYPKSGYAIYRDSWGNKKDFRNSAQLILKAGCLSQYHHQQDESNIVLYASGEDWLIDSGLYNYINKDPIRRYIRKRVAHNIPLISNSDYDYSNFSSRYNWKLNVVDNTDNKLSVIMSNEVLMGIYLERNVSIMEAGGLYFNVKDKMIAKDNMRRNFQLQWHIPDDKEIVVEDNCVYVKSKKQRLVLKISSSLEPINILINRGVKGDRIHSISSRYMGEYQNSQVIRFIFSKEQQYNIKTSFELYEE